MPARFLLVCCFFLAHKTLRAQYTAVQIDSICNAIDSAKNTRCTIACGRISSRQNCYSAENDETLLNSSGFLYIRDTNFLYQYHYVDNTPIKAVLSLQYPVNNLIYSATYYFNGDKPVKVVGENINLSNTELALSYAKAHSYWFPKACSPVNQQHALQ